MNEVKSQGQSPHMGPSGQGSEAHSPFEVLGDRAGALPVLFSVPHAGRDYPSSLLMRSRQPVEVLRRLEDRYADILVADLVDAGYGAVVAGTARAAIDLNRDSRDIDPRTIDVIPAGQPLIQSAKQRGGLGLFPRSLSRAGDLWSRPMPWEEALARIRTIHMPYHMAIAGLLDTIQARHGQALLIDLHSMPPLTIGERHGRPPDVVIGDRFGASASPRFAELVRAIVSRHGLTAAVNHPYPGYYLVERHGRPGAGRHAIQVEISRDLYLDDALDRPGRRVRAICALMAELAAALAEEVSRGDFAIAAE